MKIIFFNLLLLFGLNVGVNAQSSDQEIINQSYQLAFGANPSSENMASWLKDGGRPFNVEQLLEQHKIYLSQNDDEQRRVIQRAYKYYFGVSPDNEVESYFQTAKKQSGMLYRQIASELKKFLADNDNNQRDVIIRSYQEALHITPSEGNIESWMKACRGNGCGFAQLTQQHNQYVPPVPPVTIKVSTQNAAVYISTKSGSAYSCGCNSTLGGGSKTYLFNSTSNTWKVDVTTTNYKTNNSSKTEYTISPGQEIYVGCSVHAADCTPLSYQTSNLRKQ